MENTNLNLIIKTHLKSYQCYVFDCTTPLRLIERMEYKNHRKIAISICVEQLLKTSLKIFALEYVCKDVHIVLTAEKVNNTIRVYIYDCFDNIKCKDLDSCLDVTKKFISCEESRINQYKPFAVPLIKDGMPYTVITKVTCMVEQDILPTWQFYVAHSANINIYRACVNTGSAGIDYIIDLQSLGL